MARKRALSPSRVSEKQRIEQLEQELEEARGGLLFRAQELECAKTALESRMRTWQATLSSLGDGVIVADQSARFLYFNPAAERILGAAATESPPERWTGIYGIFLADGKTPCPEERQPLLRAIQGEELDDEELFVQNAHVPHGIWISVNARPLRDQNGVLMGGVLVFRDVTMKKKLVEKIREASRQKDEFLANMSHELRSPLNAIIGFTELLHDGVAGPVAPKHREYLGEILLSSRHLLRLLSDILDLSKVEAGKLVPNPEPHDPCALADEVVQSVHALAFTKGIALDTELDASLGTILVDGARLKQILYNFVSNALKFTPEGGRVTVRVKPRGTDGVLLEVEDTGIGIRNEDLSRLFVEFEQLDSGTAKKHGGTGLGLALTKRLVEALGGKVGVRSSPGEGSVFFAVLPRTTAAAKPPAAVARPVAPAPGSAPRARTSTPARILTVDDNPTNLELVRVLLEEQGHEVRCAASAEEALAVLEGFEPELILMDLQLPGVDGLELTRRIKALEKTRQVPVVALTAYAMKGDEQKAFDAGCDGYLTKPINTRSFAGMVLGYLRPRAKRRLT